MAMKRLIINRRIPREFKTNATRYIALFLLVLCGIYLVVAMVVASVSIKKDAELRDISSNVEDGEFSVFAPLTTAEIDNLNSYGVDIEEGFYLDYTLDSGATIRTFTVRDDINLLDVEMGVLPSSDNEVAIEKLFAKANDISVGDTLTIADVTCKVTGIVTAPDYESVLENTTDTTSDNANFGLAFMSQTLYDTLKATGDSFKTETCQYFYKFSEDSTVDDKWLKDTLKESQLNITEITDDTFLDYIVQQSDEEDLQDYDGDIKELFSGETLRKAFEDASTELMDEGLIAEELDSANYYDTLTSLSDDVLKQSESATKQLKDLQSALDSLSDNPNALDQYLAQANENLSSTISETLTADNYSEVIAETSANIKDECEENSQNLLELRDSLQELADLDFSDVNIDNLLSITTIDNNPRVGEVLSDISIMEQMGLIGGVIILVLIVYVISIFTIHSVDLESSIIGTMYSMGVSKSTLMLHYITLPVIVTFLGGLIGTIVGFTREGIGVMVDSLVSTYSISNVTIQRPMYLIVYGLIVPPVVSIVVNVLVLNKKLSQQPLALLRNQQKQNKVSKLKLKGWKFTTAFQFRQFLREFRCGIAIFFGVFLSTLMLMMSQYISVGLTNMGASLDEDLKFQNMYIYKYPDKEYDEGYKGYSKQFTAVSVVDNSTTFEVNLLGIDSDNPYFTFNPTQNEDEITISSSVAIKFQLSEGDTFTLYDEEDDVEYSFKVAEVVPYSAGLYTFMDLDTMLNFLGEDEDTYNVVFSDQDLDVDTEKLYSTITKDDFLSFVDSFVTNMSPMIYMMFGLSIVIFFAVLYLMMKVMVDHSAFSISMMRVFGYQEKEIRHLYLDGNFITFIVSALLSVPLSQKIMGKKWPQMVDHVSMGIDVTFSWKNYVVIFATMLVVYLIVSAILNHKLYLQSNKQSEVLKNRE
jgi:putative ABC transport system permease protein